MGAFLLDNFIFFASTILLAGLIVFTTGEQQKLNKVPPTTIAPTSIVDVTESPVPSDTSTTTTTTTVIETVITPPAVTPAPIARPAPVPAPLPPPATRGGETDD